MSTEPLGFYRLDKPTQENPSQNSANFGGETPCTACVYFTACQIRDTLENELYGCPKFVQNFEATSPSPDRVKL
jgi:hypothetical protein